MENIRITPNGVLILEFLRANEGAFAPSDIAEGTGIPAKAIQGSINALVKNLLLDKSDKVLKEVVNSKGLKEQREYVTYVLTQLGQEIEIVQE